MKQLLWPRHNYLLRKILLLVLVLGWASLVQAANLGEVRARYSQPRGTKISWKITIPSPPPAAVIVLQTIPVGTVIKSAFPAYNSYDPSSGTVKWLLSKVLPGTIRMRMELDRPIRKKGEIHGKIVFQDTATHPIAEGFMTLKNRKKAIEGC